MSRPGWRRSIVLSATNASTPDASKRDALNRELCDLLVFLKSPTVLAKTIALLKETPSPPPPPRRPIWPRWPPRNPSVGDEVMAAAKNPPDTQEIAYVFSLRNLRDGWSGDQRVFYFTWLRDEHKKQGGRSFQKFLDNIEQEAYENATDADRFAVDAAGLHKPYVAAELPPPLGPGQEYTVDARSRCPALADRPQLRRRQAGLRGRPLRRLPPLRKRWRRDRSQPDASRRPVQSARSLRINCRPEQGRLRSVPRDGHPNRVGPAVDRPRHRRK